MTRGALGRWGAILAAAGLVTAAVIGSNDGYYLLIATYVGINAIVALSLQLLFGFAGQVSFAQAAFYGVGAYSTAVLTTRFAWAFLPSVVVGALLAGAVAGLVGVPTLRLRGHYLAIATLAMQVAIYQFFVQASGLTGGTVGIFAIPRPRMILPTLTGQETFLVLVVAFAVVAYVLSWILLQSRFGRRMLAVREDEVAAQSLGIPVRRVKVIVFALAAAMAAVAGSLYASYIGFISPVTFSLDWSIAILAMVVVGGMGRLSGAALGAALITGVSQVLSVAGRMEFLIFGVLIVVVLVLLPRGVAGGLAELYARIRKPDAIDAAGESERVLTG